jgi:GT2 family glycosyltransferase
VVVPTHSTRDLTLRCLESLRSQRPGPDEVIVVDDASEDDTVQEVRRHFPEALVLERRARGGFTAAANQGMAAAGGDVLLLLNSDTEVLPGGLAALRRAFEEASSLGIAGGQLSYPDGAPQWSGGDEPGLLWGFSLSSGLATGLGRLPGYRSLRPVRGSAGDRRSVAWVTGAALACRRTVWHDVGPLDESFRFYCQDLDFCLRARRAGWEVAVLPSFRVVHVHGATIDKDRGTVGRQHPELLWTDLVRWARKRRGARSARRLRNVLVVGAHLRLGCGLLRLSFASDRRSRGSKRDAAVYRRAIRALQQTPEERTN